MIAGADEKLKIARELALRHETVEGGGISGLLRSLRERVDVLRQYGGRLRGEGADDLQPAEEWLLDHLDFIAGQAESMEYTLRRAGGRLPVLRAGGGLRILALCHACLDVNGDAFSLDDWVAFTNAYQEIVALSLAEVWALPVVMRVALLSNLADVMEQVRARREAGERVARFLAQLDWRKDASVTKEELRRTLDSSGESLPLSGAVVSHLIAQLREFAGDGETLRDWLSCRLDNGAENLDRIVTYEHQLQADEQVRAGHLVTGLRALARLDWRTPFTAISRVEAELRKEAAGAYSTMDFVSCDTLRQKVGELARRLGVPESLVARQAVELADSEWHKATGVAGEDADSRTETGIHRAYPVPPPRQAYAAYFLLDPAGVNALRSALRSCGSVRALPGATVARHARGAYFGGLAALFIGFFALFLGLVRLHAPSSVGWVQALAFIALALPAAEWAVASAHWLIECTAPCRPLLRCDFSRGVPPGAATMVVIPVIWSSVEDVRELCGRLELHHLANRDPNIHFALLGDFSDAPGETAAGDKEILAAARAGIEELQNRYGGAGESTFHLFHRRRRYNKFENAFMGWERKRGKLVEFVELLSGSSGTSYDVCAGDASVWPRIRYIITLDTDTQLPMGAAQRMIGTIHHPYNRPRLSEAGTRVIEGHGVLQPRIGVRHDAASRSWLAYLWAGEPGIDPYAFAVSDPYQDAFGEGIFTGKGIFDVAAFNRTLCERIPDNRVLSHDLLEGGFLRAALLSDIELIDDHPATFAAYQRRLHRWVRGDWQLLGWLLPRARDRRGRLTPVDLTPLTRWQMVDNLRRSLTVPTLLGILLASLTVLPGHSQTWAWLVLATLGIPFVRQCASITGIARHPRRLAVVAGQVVVTALLLPFQAGLLLDAALRTLWRLAVTKRHLLEWVSAAEVDRSHRSGRRPSLCCAVPGYALTGLFAAAAWFAPAEQERTFGLLLSAVWAFAPAYARLLDRPVDRVQRPLSAADQGELRALARKIWTFFETYAGQENHFLPPDNVQVDPPAGVARRTSPTNIGLYLACVVAARDLDFIDTEEMLERLACSIDTIERLDKWEGHLYNWYDTASLQPLPPLYISTVDSGNLVAAFLAVKEGVREWTATRASCAERGEDIARRLESLIQTTDFRPLYDDDAQLFSLGYHAGVRERETILYDLLASEARQASFVAIALGQVAVSHWFALGRTMTKAGGRPALLSWSGTMFEYLMPSLFLRTYRRTVWDQTYRAVLDRQMAYASGRGVHWGISESGYYAFDFQMNYQYRAFGVPGLGFKRGLEHDLVVAPYASLLALPFAPREALANLRRLDEWGAHGEHGYYEAIDCTDERMPQGERRQVIKSFMAHHQGMGLLAIANCLLDDIAVQRFHRDRRVAAADLLLQERMPDRPAIVPNPEVASPRLPKVRREEVPAAREYTDAQTPTPEVCVLANGEMTSVVTNAGGGFLRLNGLAVTRWRPDPVCDDQGVYLYIRDVTADAVWSPSHQPCQVRSERQRVLFGLDRATFMRVDGDIETSFEIAVAPEHNADIRRLTLTNTGREPHVLEVTTFVELALARMDADAAHPAFSKLFVETEYVEEDEALLAKRRPRGPSDQPLYAAHTLYVEGHALGPLEYETDRARFIGRGRDMAAPQGLTGRLTETTGAVLDPAFAIRRRVTIDPGQRVHLFTATAAANERAAALESVRRYADALQVERAFAMAFTRSQIELRHLRITAADAALYQQIAGLALYGGDVQAQRSQSLANNTLSRSALWAHGISGDIPIVLVRIDDTTEAPFVTKLAQGHRYLSRLGIALDLVIANETKEGYRQDLQERLKREAGLPAEGGGPGAIFALGAGQLTADERRLLQAVARIVLWAGGASLAAQIKREAGDPSVAAELSPGVSVGRDGPDPVAGSEACASEHEHTSWELWNGWGGLADGGREYRIRLKEGCNLPAPWINVLANPDFGALVSELGTGYVWWRNSRECKLTPWSNDPVLDRPGDALYLRDEEAGDVWSPVPGPARDRSVYTVAHGRGYSRFTHESRSLTQETTVFVPLDDPVRIASVKLRNHSPRLRRLSLTAYAEWVIGVAREESAAFVVAGWDREARALIARNAVQDHFRDAHAFLAVCVEGQETAADTLTFTCDRRSFIGRGGTLANPAALNGSRLPGSPAASAAESVGEARAAAGDPCGALRQLVEIPPDGEIILHVLLGCERSPEAVRSLLERYREGGAVHAEFDRVRAFWRETLEQIQVSTPSRETDVLLNGWLVYQALSCRLWARSAFFQSGGAYGFRDQLQDALALLHSRPDVTRRQILLHAAHQFDAGDVQHWWHEETGRGIRTRFSDDLLWLPYVAARYAEHTGDGGVWDEPIPYLSDEPLAKGQDERYGETRTGGVSGSLYDHCLRAIERTLQFGVHGLPLMGSGDWNDGLNRVGPQGKGESVWLGWFLCDVLERFAAVCTARGDTGRADRYRAARGRLAADLDEHAWDGGWYRRAYTDAGTWLGSIHDAECRIDAIAQSWAVMSGAAGVDKAQRAMHSFERELEEPHLSLVRLLMPPFDRTEPSPGYIQGYPPGIRENGGQYTHGVIWGVVAWSLLGDGDRAFKLFDMLNPFTHARTPGEVASYAGEPYVMAADVYADGPHRGRAGWTWYTGAAGWMYQAGIEWIFGLRRRGDRLELHPCLPSEWRRADIAYRFGKTRYEIELHNPAGRRLEASARLELDGQEVSGTNPVFVPSIPLTDDGQTHRVKLTL